MTMIEKVYNFIRENDMLQDGDTVVCGLSGGADSVCLLLSLLKNAERLNISVEALHINHCLRGIESDRDEQFCHDLCSRLGVPFSAVSCDVKAFAGQNSLSTEEAARKLRYEQFHLFSKGKKLATAHNANDNLETVILNLSRGTALKGLTGFPVIRGNIIRPLLVCTRDEIERYLVSVGQDWITDSTNLSDDYTRNKIRHKILPLMQEINTSVIETSVRSISAVRSEENFIESQVDEALSACRSGDKFVGLSNYNGVIRKRCLARLLSDNALPYSYKRLEQADGILLSGGKLNISHNRYLVSDRNSIELVFISEKKHETLKSDLKIGDNSIFPDKTLVSELIECDDLPKNDCINKKLTFYLLDYDKIIGRAVVRSRVFGDKIMLKGRNFNSSVKKLINEKIPSAQRDTLHFIEDEEGTIFAEDLGIAQRVAPDEMTKRFLRIHIKTN